MKQVERNKIQIRNQKLELRTTQSPDNQDMVIEGYFVVFNRETELFPGGFEEICAGVFDECLDRDIRALTNHDPTFVLGRTKNGTLSLRSDSTGLWGSIRINPNDVDAMNLYARVERGDVSQCSFGFNVLDESVEERDGGIKWYVRKALLHEVSVCTFPAYEETSVQAREKEFKKIHERKLEQAKQELLRRLKSGGKASGNK